MKDPNNSQGIVPSKKKRNKVVNKLVTPLKPTSTGRSILTSRTIYEASPNNLRSTSIIFSPVVGSPKAKRTRIDINAIRSPISSPLNTHSSSLHILSNNAVSPKPSKDTILEDVFGSPSSIISATSKLSKEQKQAAFDQWLKVATANVFILSL